MIDLDELSIVHYCHPSCKPFLNICRLTREEAFKQAYRMANENPNTTAFGRFADFEYYYPRRMITDACIYDMFVLLGGNPQEKHPLSFVLQGSDYLHSWFGNGIKIRIKLADIPSEYVSFTLGDSMRAVSKNRERITQLQPGQITMYTKEMLIKELTEFDGSLPEYMNEVAQKYKYIEAQVWNDEYCKV
ncbi:MAG: hypothetical protein FWG21_06525 [Oscillospiraceae bacterium]|nr:hypothetical protein [Oscillospiraceae bacterium]